MSDIPTFDPRKEKLKRLLNRMGLLVVFRQIHDRFNPIARAQRRSNAVALQRIGQRLAPLARQVAEQSQRTQGTALFIGMGGVNYVLQQLPVIAGVVAHGLRPIIVLPSRANREDRRLYELCGVQTFVFWDDQPECSEGGSVMKQLAACESQSEVVELRWKDVAVGKYAISTLMRRMRAGQLDLTQPALRSQLEIIVRRALDHTAAAIRFIEEWRPQLVVFVDRGYTPEGPFFEACINHGIRPITFNAAHRDNTLMLKRYGPGNSNVHPGSLSTETWTALRDAMPWTASHWSRLREQFEFCYRTGQWYSVVGTQFRARLMDREALLARLKLDLTKKTVLLFPHIFWDATFFWGRDIFSDYEEWFRESVRGAWANDQVNWIIKVHPANLVKNQRDGVKGEYSEIRVLREFGTIPSHIRVLSADTEISTLSLFAVGDFCLTVRGTVGIEAAMLGLNVVTAGTGRYDRHGFTTDMTNADEYRALLGRIHELPAPQPEQVELARRYAYGVFLLRPLEMSSVRFSYARTQDAAIQVEVPADAGTEFLRRPDIAAIARWLTAETEDFVVDGAMSSE